MGDIRDYEPLWGAWYVDGLIGEGFYGKVWRVRRHKDGKTVYAAVKMITIPYSESELELARHELPEHAVREHFHMFVEDILHEAKLAFIFSNEANIVPVEDYQVIESDSVHWDVLAKMELLNPLLQYREKHPLSTEDVMRLGIDISRALEVISSENIIHMDIKPDNIFVSECGDFKLDIFGSSLRKHDSNFFRKGSCTYMAPEVYDYQPCDSRADLYSLGIVMYRFLNNNRLPFFPPFPEPLRPSDREKALHLRMKGDEPLPDIPDIHPALNAFVLKACAYRPDDRFTDASEFRAELQKLRHIMKGE